MGRLGGVRRWVANRELLRRLQRAYPFAEGDGVRIDLGCGTKKAEGFIGIDRADLQGVDIVHDVAADGIPFADSSVDVVRAYDFLEHVRDTVFVMNEIHRVLRPNGLVDIRVPSTDGRGAFQDPTHVSFWNENSFSYYLSGGAREVLGYYGIRCRFAAETLYTTRKNYQRICHVVARLRAVKTYAEVEQAEANRRNAVRERAGTVPPWVVPGDGRFSEERHATR